MCIRDRSTYAYSKLLNIHKNAGNLKNLITELLDFRKQEQGLLKLKISQFDLYSLLKEHYVLFKELAANRNISFTLRADCEQCMIWGDRLQLQKVVNNLLSNAFKFTPDGGTVTIRLQDHAGYVILSVEDNGKGIQPQNLSSVFDQFFYFLQVTTGCFVCLIQKAHIPKKQYCHLI